MTEWTVDMSDLTYIKFCQREFNNLTSYVLLLFNHTSHFMAPLYTETMTTIKTMSLIASDSTINKYEMALTISPPALKYVNKKWHWNIMEDWG